MLTQREMDEIKLLAQLRIQQYWEEFEKLYKSDYDFERAPDEEINPLLGMEVEEAKDGLQQQP
jgi:hypothetical protein